MECVNIGKSGMQSVFTDARRKQSIAATEFRQFRERAILEIPAICGSLDRFAELEREFSFRIDELDEQDHLQCSFGSRSMDDIRDFEGKLEIEKGPRLVYSLSRTGGLMMTDLFSASSTLGGVSEDHVSLRIGSYSAYQLSAIKAPPNRHQATSLLHLYLQPGDYPFHS